MFASSGSLPLWDTLAMLLAVWLSCNGSFPLRPGKGQAVRGVQMRLPPKLLVTSCSTTERHIQPSITRYLIPLLIVSDGVEAQEIKVQ